MKNFRFMDFKNCIYLVQSRAFDLKMAGSTNRVLVPYADILHNRIPQKISWLFNEKTSHL